MAFKVDTIAKITDIKETWKIKARCIHSYISYKVDKPDERTHMDIILMDVEGSKIQAFVPKCVIHRFEDKIQPGGFYYLSNFEVHKNLAGIRLTQHGFRLEFHQNTGCRPCENLSIPEYGFEFVSFRDVYSKREYERCLIDIIGKVVKIGDVNISIKEGITKKRVNIELQDNHSKILKCTLWNDYATQFLKFEEGFDPHNPLVLILQFAKAQRYKGDLSVSNYFYSTKLILDSDVREIREFTERIVALGETTHKRRRNVVSESSSTTADDFSCTDEYIRLIDVQGIKKVSTCVVLARMHSLQTHSGWCYYSCKTCTRKVVEDEGRMFCNHCDTLASDVILKYKVHVRVTDDFDNYVSVVLFDGNAYQIVGKSAQELKDVLVKDGDDDGYPEALESLMGKRFLMKLEVSSWTLTQRNKVFTVLKISDEKELISNFEAVVGSVEHVTEKSSIYSTNAGSESVASMDLTPLNKRRLSFTSDGVVDLDNYEDQNSSSKRFVKVKIEKED